MFVIDYAIRNEQDFRKIWKELCGKMGKIKTAMYTVAEILYDDQL